MPVTTSYPGIYIEELPNTSRTIAAAPTSNTVFIGYSHPYKTKSEHFGKAVQIFSFAEYEREFGGLFRSAHLFSDLPYAVQNFFLNGGSVAFIVALNPDLPEARVDFGPVRFTALEPVDDVTPLRITLGNFQDSNTLADLTFTYRTRTETFRRVPIANLVTTLANGSALVRASFPGGTTPTAYATAKRTDTVSYASTPSPAAVDPLDFTPVFQEDSSLDKVDVINLMTLPGVSSFGVLSEALAFCERKRAFLIMDPPAEASADGTVGGPAIVSGFIDTGVIPRSSPNGALYFPYLVSPDPLTGQAAAFPPSGFIAGIYARTDTNRGVWKAPAGLETTVNNVLGVVETGRMTDMRAGVLNTAAVNAIRTFPASGTVVFGARTLVAANTAFQQWKYVPVRRMALFIEQTLYANLGWVVFEPNADPLWVAIRTSIEAFMLSLFRQGAFFGTTPTEAFLVKCDATTTTQTDIDNGRVNILVGFRPLKPAEFVIIQIAQLAGQAQS
ncbi:phage tail sheath family protein [Archangium lansingense]|uniref:Phage tail sheath subtilisin-like domain-containing protein n=1 Tax=Archangium lansingense TaxID=2995310 RepID=A0ABT4AAM3_9BACT|nr:phage tail sheath C-terminal domain-containing protein [Archangium lansinium]MCY1078695.1 phage tail sheath subtilisin-like domain-containing protein [Archangium lansinium]